MTRPTEYGPLALIGPELRRIAEERDHYGRRKERAAALFHADRREGIIVDREAEYADGIRYGLDLALQILHRDVA